MRNCDLSFELLLNKVATKIRGVLCGSNEVASTVKECRAVEEVESVTLHQLKFSMKQACGRAQSDSGRIGHERCVFWPKVAMARSKGVSVSCGRSSLVEGFK